MSENTEHSHQKSEKLITRLILATSDERDLIFDPFAGTGVVSVISSRLNRNFITIELDETWCCVAQKRLNLDL